jgi:hypothetical protein
MTTFIVKWCYNRDGAQLERLIETDQVNAAYDERTPDRRKPDAPALMFGCYQVPASGGIVILGNYYEGADSMCLSFGTVYVMNRDGKTVAKYHLSKDAPWEDKVKGEESSGKIAA